MNLSIDTSKNPPVTRERKRFPWLAVLYWVLAAAWLALIFMFGGQTGEESGNLSASILRLLQRLFPYLPFQSEKAHLLLRKCAHFGIFCVEAGLLTLAVWRTFGPGRYVLTFVLHACLALAAGNEIEQMYVDGRGPSVVDVLIDFGGALLGATTIHGIMRARRKRIARREEKNGSTGGEGI